MESARQIRQGSSTYASDERGEGGRVLLYLKGTTHTAQHTRGTGERDASQGMQGDVNLKMPLKIRKKDGTYVYFVYVSERMAHTYMRVVVL